MLHYRRFNPSVPRAGVAPQEKSNPASLILLRWVEYETTSRIQIRLFLCASIHPHFDIPRHL